MKLQGCQRLNDSPKVVHCSTKQAFELRNKYKRQARIAMSDIETVERLEKKKPVPTFEEMLKHKIEDKHMTEEEALKDILKTASKTNADVNKEFDL